MDGIVQFIDRFDVKNPRHQSLGRFIGVIGIVVFIAIPAIFLSTALHQSSGKNFWEDETYGLNCAVRTNSLAHLLMSGAQGQGSPAPLDYIFLKALDDLRTPLHLEWVPFNTYYRLNSIWWTLLAGAGSTFLFFYYFRSKTSNYFILLLQIIFLAQGLVYFYFRHDDFHFAIEARPYALWNSLWFAFMALFLFYREFNWALLLISTALALASGGSLFQIVVFILCRFALQFYETKGFMPSLKKTLLEFSLPLLVSMYYSSKSPHFVYSTSVESYHGYLKEFFAFWAGKSKVMVFSVLGIAMTFFHKKWRKASVVFLAMLLLYLLSPLCNYVVLSQGLFFTRRQYLYYDLAFCIFTFSLSLTLPDYWDIIKNHYLSRK